MEQARVLCEGVGVSLLLLKRPPVVPIIHAEGSQFLKRLESPLLRFMFLSHI